METQKATDKPTKRELAIDAAIVGRAVKDRIGKLTVGEAQDLARSLVADMQVNEKRQLIWKLDELIKARKKWQKPAAAKTRGGSRATKAEGKKRP